MNNKISLYIHSYDNKTYLDEVDEVYFTSFDKGDVAILINSINRVAILSFSSFYIVKDNKKTYFTTSGGILDFNDNKCNLFLETFENEKDLNKEKIEESKKKAEAILAKKSEFSEKEIEKAEYSLKKAINRLKIIK